MQTFRNLLERAAEVLENQLKVPFESTYELRQEIRLALLEPAPDHPVMQLEAERLLGQHGEYAFSVLNHGWLESCRKDGGTFSLYDRPTGAIVKLEIEGGPSDRYECYLTATDGGCYAVGPEGFDSPYEAADWCERNGFAWEVCNLAPGVDPLVELAAWRAAQ